jgi:hypothetical protein
MLPNRVNNRDIIIKIIKTRMQKSPTVAKLNVQGQFARRKHFLADVLSPPPPRFPSYVSSEN